MKHLTVVAVFVGLLLACSDMLGPEDPEWEDKCVIYVPADTEYVDITEWQLDNCRSLRIWFVHYPEG
jgi:hypothetical protein